MTAYKLHFLLGDPCIIRLILLFSPSATTMIDVHAHINYVNFPRNNTMSDQDDNKPTLDMMIDHAKKASIQHIVAVSESIHDVHDIFEIASTSDNFIWPARGLHPVQLDDNKVERSVNWHDFEMFEPVLQDAIQQKKICCVGEGMIYVVCGWMV